MTSHEISLVWQHNPDALSFLTCMGLDVLRVLREANLRVPDDIALIGFDDLPLAQQTDPPVTTVCQPVGRRNSEASMVPVWPRTTQGSDRPAVSGGSMSQNSEQMLLEELKDFDTPSITNVVATYPGSPFCLGLYNPWSENWYTDQTIRCMYPELGRLAGYAVTCVYGLPDPTFSRLSFLDVIDALAVSKGPTILVLQQKFPPEIAGKVGLAGGNMVSALKAIGCVGLISNGPSRDLDEVRPMRFQYMLSGVTAGHGPLAVHAINVPVSVGGMDVAPAEIIHMDENGAVKFPANRLEAVVKNARDLQKEETARMQALQQATSAAEIRAIMAGHAYTAPEQEQG